MRATDKAEVIKFPRAEKPKAASPLKAVAKPQLTQRDIDERVGGWEWESESSNAMVARLLTKFDR